MIAIDLDPANHGANDFARAVPVQLIQALVNLVGEILKVTNDQRQVALHLGVLGGSAPLFFQTRQTLLHAGNAWFEFGAVDDPFGVAVDEPGDAAAQAGDLMVEPSKGVGATRAIPPLSETPFIFVGQTLRVFEGGPDFIPHGPFKTVAAHGTIVTDSQPGEAVCIGPWATIVAVVGGLPATDRATRHLAVERVPALSADHQPLQQPPWPPAAFPAPATVFIELRLRRLEHRGIHQGRHRNFDPLLARCGNARVGMARRVREPTQWP
ncbi:hypothetical protein M5E06_31630 [Azospirillum sp. A1-3]|nr:hypothetical protein [Azospirillum sp. A1-3]MCM8738662.1 hypothetical protein [Azospirillum sp. A1-3]